MGYVWPHSLKTTFRQTEYKHINIAVELHIRYDLIYWGEYDLAGRRYEILFSNFLKVQHYPTECWHMYFIFHTDNTRSFVMHVFGKIEAQSFQNIKQNLIKLLKMLNTVIIYYLVTQKIIKCWNNLFVSMISIGNDQFMISYY